MEWPVVILILGLLFIAVCVWAGFYSVKHENRKLDVDTSHVDEVRALVTRYEQLAAGSLDAQNRTAADVSELLSRTAAIEKILRTVE